MTKKHKTLKICEDNKHAIVDWLNEVNGTATRFTIISYHGIADYAAHIAKMMDKENLTRQERKGAEITHTPAGPSTNAYKYSVKTTTFKLRIGADGKTFFLVNLQSDTQYPKSPARQSIKLKPESKASWLARQAATFDVLPGGE